MVEKFSYFTETGISLPLNMGVDVELFEEDNEAKILAFYEADVKGVKWIHKKKWIQLIEQNTKVSGYPSADMNYVIVVYPITSEKCPPPFNALVYNTDGSIHMQLEVPELKSKLPKDRAKRMRKTKNVAPPDRLFFYGIKWQNVDGQVITVAKIGFDRDCWEERVFNPETGVFGKCLKSNIK